MHYSYTYHFSRVHVHIEDDVLTELWSKKMFHHNSILLKDGIQRSHVNSITLLHALPQIFPIHPYPHKTSFFLAPTFLAIPDAPLCGDGRNFVAKSQLIDPVTIAATRCAKTCNYGLLLRLKCSPKCSDHLVPGLEERGILITTFLCDEAPKNSTPTFCRGVGHTARTWRNKMEWDNRQHCLKDRSISV